MFSHIVTSVSDFDRAYQFYRAVLGVLDLEQRFLDRQRPWAGWQSAGGQRPLFVICKPFNGAPHEPGNGQMVAFLAANREQVRSAHQTALSHGGADDGAPGLRPSYHADYYGAYFRDPDSNKVCVVCHEKET